MFPFNSIVIFFLCSLIIIPQLYFCARKLIYYVICGIGHHVKIYGNNDSNNSVTGGDQLPRNKAVKRSKLSEISFTNGLKLIEQPICFCSTISSSFLLRTCVTVLNDCNCLKEKPSLQEELLKDCHSANLYLHFLRFLLNGLSSPLVL